MATQINARVPWGNRLQARARAGWPSLAVGAATLLVFLPSVSNGFVNWDDDVNFLTNENYRGLGPTQLRWMWTTMHNGPYQPLSWMSLGLDHAVGGMNARGYHLTNVLLHVIAAMTLTSVVVRLSAAPGITSAPESSAHSHNACLGLMVGVAWALHPLRVEPVAWITERREVLCGALTLLAIRSSLSGGGRVAVAIWALLALLAKGTAVTLAPILVLCDIHRSQWRHGAALAPIVGAALRRHAVVILLAAIFSVVAVAGQRGAGAAIPLTALGIGERAVIFLYAAGFYAWKTLVPLGLAPLYEAPADRSTLFLPAMLAMAAVCALLLVGWRMRRRVPGLVIGVVAYIVFLLPVGGLVQVGSQVAADRYAYQSGWMLSLGAGALLAAMINRIMPARGHRGVASVIAAAVLAACLMPLTWKQQHIWHDTRALWTHQLAVRPDTAVGRFNMAMELVRSGAGDAARQRDAEEHLRAAIAKFPTRYVDAWWQLGRMLARRHEWNQAKGAFRSCVDIRPNYAPALQQLGNVSWLAGDMDEALHWFSRLVQADARQEDPYLILARAQAAAGRPIDAARTYAAGIAEIPASAPLHGELAQLLCTHPDAAVRDGPKAIAHAEAAVRHAGADARYSLILAAAQAESGEYARAEAALTEARRIAPAELVAVIDQVAESFRLRRPLRQMPAFTPALDDE